MFRSLVQSHPLIATAVAVGGVVSLAYKSGFSFSPVDEEEDDDALSMLQAVLENRDPENIERIEKQMGSLSSAFDPAIIDLFLAQFPFDASISTTKKLPTNMGWRWSYCNPKHIYETFFGPLLQLLNEDCLLTPADFLRQKWAEVAKLRNYKALSELVEFWKLSLDSLPIRLIISGIPASVLNPLIGGEYKAAPYGIFHVGLQYLKTQFPLFKILVATAIAYWNARVEYGNFDFTNFNDENPKTFYNGTFKANCHCFVSFMMATFGINNSWSKGGIVDRYLSSLTRRDNTKAFYDGIYFDTHEQFDAYLGRLETPVTSLGEEQRTLLRGIDKAFVLKALGRDEPLPLMGCPFRKFTNIDFQCKV